MESNSNDGYDESSFDTDTEVDLSDPSNWSAVKKKDNDEDNNVNDLNKKMLRSTVRYLPFDEAVKLSEEKIRNLLKLEDFTGAETLNDLKFLQKLTRYSNDIVLTRRLVDRLVKYGIAHVFLRVWNCIFRQEEKLLDEIAFKNLQEALSVIWNCSDKSTTLCDLLVKCGFLNHFLSELRTEKFVDQKLTDKNTLYLLKSFLGILHNIVRFCTDSRRSFRAANGMLIFQRYINSEIRIIRMKAYLCLAYVVTEQENTLINASGENLAFIIQILKEALKSENHFCKHYAFTADEIICGLNHLAVCDKNKVGIINQGALPCYVAMLKSDKIEEQALAASGIWILSFHPENQNTIRSDLHCMLALQKLASESTESSIKRSARGALWVLKQKTSTPSTSVQIITRSSSITDNLSQPEDQSDLLHVMLSYNHAVQATAMKIKRYLVTNGYKVWMDVDNMMGSTLEAMALAVERSAVILVCVTERYKDSTSCRTEAEYVYQLKKDIIPLLLQSNYTADGWLGCLIGSKLFYDFTNDTTFSANAARLIREIGTRGKLPGRTPFVLKQKEHEIEEGVSLLSPTSSASSASLHSHLVTCNQNLSTWRSEDVINWLRINQLSHLCDKFAEFNGELLQQYHQMLLTAPEYFYSSLERHLQADLVNILKFTKALESLTS